MERPSQDFYEFLGFSPDDMQPKPSASPLGLVLSSGTGGSKRSTQRGESNALIYVPQVESATKTATHESFYHISRKTLGYIFFFAR